MNTFQITENKKQITEATSDGLLLSARYAFMPNKLKYCGGDRNSQIFAYMKEGLIDGGLNDLLKEFETMYPYLRLIATANRIIDPFDSRVVEAYWLGNELLTNVKMKKLYNFSLDVQQVKKRLKPELVEKLFGKMKAGAKPHHNWHVFNVFRNLNNMSAEVLNTMDQCRIADARVKNKELKSKNILSEIIVCYKPIIYVADKLILGEEVEKKVTGDSNLIDNLNQGDYVAIHWDWVCDQISELQARNLRWWTSYNLGLINRW